MLAESICLAFAVLPLEASVSITKLTQRFGCDGQQNNVQWDEWFCIYPLINSIRIIRCWYPYGIHTPGLLPSSALLCLIVPPVLQVCQGYCSVCLSVALWLPSPSPFSSVRLWGELHWGNVSNAQVKGDRGGRGAPVAPYRLKSSWGHLLTPAKSGQFEERVSNRKEIKSIKYKFLGPTKIMLLKISIS